MKACSHLQTFEALKTVVDVFDDVAIGLDGTSEFRGKDSCCVSAVGTGVAISLSAVARTPSPTGAFSFCGVLIERAASPHISSGLPNSISIALCLHQRY